MAPLDWRTRRDEKQCLDTLERSGKTLGTLEVENCALDPTLPKRRRLALAVNARTSRHSLVCELCNDMLSDLPAGSGDQEILLSSLMMLFSFAMLFSLHVFSGALNGTSHGVTHQPAPRTDAARIGSA